MSSITRVLHTTTWDYFTSRLPDLFNWSPKVVTVTEAIMADINDLVQEFWRTSSDGDVGASIFAMRRLHDILQRCFDTSEVCFDVISVFANAVDDKNPQNSANLNSRHRSAQSDLDDRIKILFHRYQKMLDQSLSRSKELGDLLRFLPGIVVQKHMNMEVMGHLYRIEPDLLGRLFNSSIEPLRLKASFSSRTILDDYLSRFLQDRDRSQHYYCDPMLQHISICRHFLSLLDGSNTFGHQS
jgi:hypothetical protein